jgi:hypothetical protein
MAEDAIADGCRQLTGNNQNWRATITTPVGKRVESFSNWVLGIKLVLSEFGTLDDDINDEL